MGLDEKKRCRTYNVRNMLGPFWKGSGAWYGGVHGSCARAIL